MEQSISSTSRHPGSVRRYESITKEKPVVALPRPMGAIPEEVCPRCLGAGWLRRDVPVGHPHFGKPIRCQCRIAEHLKLSLSRTYRWLGAGGAQVQTLETMTFASFDPRANGEQVARAYQRSQHYANELQACATPSKNVLFVGPYGVGKTHLACAILNTARAAGVECLFAAGNELFQALYDSAFDERLLQQAIETPVLCLDDLDKLQKKEDGSYQKAFLFTLLNQRHLAGRPVILTANTQDDWKAWLHEAVLSRLFGQVEAIGMQGRDYRMMSSSRPAERR